MDVPVSCNRNGLHYIQTLQWAVFLVHLRRNHFGDPLYHRGCSIQPGTRPQTALAYLRAVNNRILGLYSFGVPSNLLEVGSPNSSIKNL